MARLSPRALDELTGAFRSRLVAVMPAGVSSEEVASDIYSQLELIDQRGGGVEENALDAAEMILSDVQDRVVRDVKKGWPPSRAGRSEGDSGADLPLPEAAIVDGELRLWFGDGGSPALALDPILLGILT